MGGAHIKGIVIYMFSTVAERSLGMGVAREDTLQASPILCRIAHTHLILQLHSCQPPRLAVFARNRPGGLTLALGRSVTPPRNSIAVC